MGGPPAAASASMNFCVVGSSMGAPAPASAEVASDVVTAATAWIGAMSVSCRGQRTGTPPRTPGRVRSGKSRLVLVKRAPAEAPLDPERLDHRLGSFYRTKPADLACNGAR